MSSRTEETYAVVRNARFDLYQRAVAIGVMAGLYIAQGKDSLKVSAEVEKSVMDLIRTMIEELEG